MNLDFLPAFLEWAATQGAVAALLLIFGKTIGAAIFNVISAQKITQDIQKSYLIKKVVQNAESSRLLIRANRVLVTQLHNGDKWYSGSHMFKLSLMQELSIEDPEGIYRMKIFDRQLKNILLSQLSPLLTIASSKRSYDILSASDLKDQGFFFHRHLKVDKISYIIIVKIQHSKEILGYLLFIFVDGAVPDYDKNRINKLIELGYQIGALLV